jgi:thymidylate synthase
MTQTQVIYTPIYKPNQLICGTGRIAIITGWTVKAAVAKHLEPDQYAVIGQLYSAARGINFLLRNLLANPQVDSLVILNATKEDKNAGSCQCLFDFFTNGFYDSTTDTGKPCWQVHSPVAGYIDKEIPAVVLEELRSRTSVQMLDTIPSAVAQVKAWAALPPRALTIPVRVYPLADNPNGTTLPGPVYGHRVEGTTVADTWVRILHLIRRTGIVRPTGYDGQWQELIDLMAVVTDEPPGFYFPEPNYLPIDQDFIQHYLPQVLEDAPYQEGVKYTYGQRMRSWFGHDQIQAVIQKLAKEIDSASAVINLWDSGGNLNRRPDGSSDHQHSGSPCLNHVWVRVIPQKAKDELEMSLTALFRSNDMFSAWPANAMGLRGLQEHIRVEVEKATGLAIALGPLVTISQSAHVYDDCWENADQTINLHYKLERPNYTDPVGNFVIEPDGEGILVTQVHPASGYVVATYRGHNPLQVVRQICHSNPAITPDHAAYLGMELLKLKMCLEEKSDYRQDAL